MNHRLVAAVSVAGIAAALLAAPHPSGASTGADHFYGDGLHHRAHHYPHAIVQSYARESRWHVRDAVAAWHIPGVRYGHCHPGPSCITVVGRDQPHPPVPGELGATYLTSRGARIVLNRHDAGSLTPAVLQQATVHELGHALGLGHDHTRRGVMRPVDDGTGHVNGFERRELRDLYLHDARRANRPVHL